MEPTAIVFLYRDKIFAWKFDKKLKETYYIRITLLASNHSNVSHLQLIIESFSSFFIFSKITVVGTCLLQNTYAFHSFIFPRR
jgi:hypothetical protein